MESLWYRNFSEAAVVCICDLISLEQAVPDFSYLLSTHLQVLAYSSEKLENRLSYLRSLGLSMGDVARMVRRLPQLLSLDIAANLQPKVAYLSKQLHGHPRMLAANPAYLTLSLQGRCVEWAAVACMESCWTRRPGFASNCRWK